MANKPPASSPDFPPEPSSAEEDLGYGVVRGAGTRAETAAPAQDTAAPQPIEAPAAASSAQSGARASFDTREALSVAFNPQDRAADYGRAARIDAAALAQHVAEVNAWQAVFEPKQAGHEAAMKQASSFELEALAAHAHEQGLTSAPPPAPGELAGMAWEADATPAEARKAFRETLSSELERTQAEEARNTMRSAVYTMKRDVHAAAGRAAAPDIFGLEAAATHKLEKGELDTLSPEQINALPSYEQPGGKFMRTMDYIVERSGEMGKDIVKGFGTDAKALGKGLLYLMTHDPRRTYAEIRESGSQKYQAVRRYLDGRSGDITPVGIGAWYNKIPPHRKIALSLVLGGGTAVAAASGGVLMGGLFFAGLTFQRALAGLGFGVARLQGANAKAAAGEKHGLLRGYTDSAAARTAYASAAGLAYGIFGAVGGFAGVIKAAEGLHWLGHAMGHEAGAGGGSTPPAPETPVVRPAGGAATPSAHVEVPRPAPVPLAHANEVGAFPGHSMPELDAHGHAVPGPVDLSTPEGVAAMHNAAIVHPPEVHAPDAAPAEAAPTGSTSAAPAETSSGASSGPAAPEQAATPPAAGGAGAPAPGAAIDTSTLPKVGASTHGYEGMVQDLWNQLRGKNIPLPADHNSDLYKLLTADEHTIGAVAHRIALDPDHHAFDLDKVTGTMKHAFVGEHAQMAIDDQGHIVFSADGRAPMAEHVDKLAELRSKLGLKPAAPQPAAVPAQSELPPIHDSTSVEPYPHTPGAEQVAPSPEAPATGAAPESAPSAPLESAIGSNTAPAPGVPSATGAPTELHPGGAAGPVESGSVVPGIPHTPAETLAYASAHTAEPHLYADAGGKTLTLWGGTPAQVSAWFDQHLAEHPNAAIDAPSTDGKHLVRYHVDGAGKIAGIETPTSSGFLGFFKSFMRASSPADTPEAFSTLVQ